MTPSPTSGHRRTAKFLSAIVAGFVLAAAAGAQQTSEPAPAPVAVPPSVAIPAPVVRVQRHPATQSVPGTAAAGHTATPAAAPAAQGTVAASATSSTTSSSAKPSVASPSAAGMPAGTSGKPAKPAADHPSNVIHGLNRNVVVLDPSHGGSDAGARIGDNILEKDVTLSLAFRLRSLLLARGFTVVMTRDSDAATIQTSPTAAPTPLTLDDRAGIADHAHASACLLLHATGRGTGLHVYNSEIEPIPAEPYLVPWLTGQAAWVPASRALESGIGAALGRSGVALLTSTASVRPVNSLTCPALVLELAPQNGTPGSINEAGYQERVAAALAGALVVWENAVQPPPRLPAPVHRTHGTATPETAAADAKTPPATETQP